jgi:hypothetical protein
VNWTHPLATSWVPAQTLTSQRLDRPGDAGAVRGDCQLGFGAHGCLVGDVDLGAEAILVVADDLTQGVHCGPFAQCDENSSG